MKNLSIKITLSAFMLSLSIIANAQTTEKKVELKPVTTPLKKESPKFTASTRPINSNNSVTFTKVPSNNVGIRGNEIIGEGRYLNFDKQIMQRSVSGEIPSGFPMHVKGQTQDEYIQTMLDWAKQHPNEFKPESHYLDYDQTIKAMTIDGQIPNNFPKHVVGQRREEYLLVMKEWAKQNINLFKYEYWSTINK